MPDPADGGFSARDIADLLDWPLGRVQGLARDGTVPAGRDTRGRYRFAFPELVVFRALKDLTDAGISMRRLKQSLKQLRRWLPDGRPLSTLRLATAGNRVMVRDGSLWFEPDSGQGVLPLAAEGEPSEAVIALDTPDPDSDALYHRALALEDTDPAAARDAYRQAIARDDRHADAHINLGRLLQLDGDLDTAEGHYRAALEREPEHPLARFNLGTLLEDRGRLDPAIALYESCVDELPDAHYNLARLHEQAGRKERALYHLRALRLTCH